MIDIYIPAEIKDFNVWFKHLGAILINLRCSVSKLCLTLHDPMVTGGLPSKKC